MTEPLTRLTRDEFEQALIVRDRELADLRAERDDWTLQHTLLRDDYTQLKISNETIRAERDALRGELIHTQERWEATEVRQNIALNKVAALTRKLAEVEHDKTLLAEQLEDSIERTASAQTKLAASEQVIKDLRSQLDNHGISNKSTSLFQQGAIMSDLRKACDTVLGEIVEQLDLTALSIKEAQALRDMITAFAKQQRAEVWREQARKFRTMENYYGCMAEGQNEPEFKIYITAENTMRQERLLCEQRAREMDA